VVAESREGETMYPSIVPHPGTVDSKGRRNGKGTGSLYQHGDQGGWKTGRRTRAFWWKVVVERRDGEKRREKNLGGTDASGQGYLI